ncbi:MAG: fasciclin domain-containing protein [Mucilaginibacter sp.]|uniref:fasciclin domain-containing protein n=1 Tax=Mucilaginibacter sp. TaxID=1882438 RepID=UPI003263B479
MKAYLKYTKRAVFCFLSALVLMFVACKKNNYYVDGGLSDPNFKGNMLQYLQAKPFYFDTIATVIKMAGLEQNFQQDDMTFFAPTDHSIARIILFTNQQLYANGKDTIKTLAEVSPSIWRKYLKRYMFHGANKLNDYPQLDLNIQALYPGQDYYSYGNDILNIGVVYDDVNGIKYAGYRHLVISYIPDLNKPLYWYTNYISSSDIKPTNGVVHTLNDYTTFGFNLDFVNDVYATR